MKIRLINEWVPNVWIIMLGGILLLAGALWFSREDQEFTRGSLAYRCFISSKFIDSINTGSHTARYSRSWVDGTAPAANSLEVTSSIFPTDVIKSIRTQMQSLYGDCQLPSDQQLKEEVDDSGYRLDCHAANSSIDIYLRRHKGDWVLNVTDYDLSSLFAASES